MDKRFAVPRATYDNFMGRYSERLAPLFCDFAGVSPGELALDVGCGPGALTGELVQRLGAGSVCAADPSPPFVEAVRERLPGVVIQEAPAEKLPFADDSVDVALAQLVVPFMRDPDAGVREMMRVAGPGKRVAICMWARDDMELLSAFWDAAAAVDAASAAQRDERMAYRTRGELEALLERNDVTGLRAELLTVEGRYEVFDDLAGSFTGGVGPIGQFYVSLDAAKKEALMAELRRRVGDPDGPFALRASAWAIMGQAPMMARSTSA
jgi:SAM-dependent methyltransferase